MWFLFAALLTVQPVLVDAKKPGVYLTFERADKTHYDLRIHNNTRWELWIRQFGDVSKEVDVGLFYVIREDPAGYPPNPLPQGTSCHVCSVNPIESGTSLRFRVPKSHLGEGLAIRTYFEYEGNAAGRSAEWESRGALGDEGETPLGVPVEPIRIPPPPVLKNP